MWMFLLGFFIGLWVPCIVVSVQEYLADQKERD